MCIVGCVYVGCGFGGGVWLCAVALQQSTILATTINVTVIATDTGVVVATIVDFIVNVVLIVAIVEIRYNY